MRDKISVKGSFNLKIMMDGEVVEEYTDPNLVVMLGKKNIAQILGGHVDGKKISQISCGTNTTAPALTDTYITSPFTKNVDSATYPADNQVTYHFLIGASEANGMTIAEFGLLNENGVLCARKTRTPIVKVSPMSIAGAWTLTIN